MRRIVFRLGGTTFGHPTPRSVMLSKTFSRCVKTTGALLSSDGPAFIRPARVWPVYLFHSGSNHQAGSSWLSTAVLTNDGPSVLSKLWWGLQPLPPERSRRTSLKGYGARTDADPAGSRRDCTLLAFCARICT